MSALTVAPPGSFADSDTKALIDGYRQVVAQRLIPCSVTGLGKLLSMGPYYVSRKIDGELWFLVAGDDPSLVAANGRVATGRAPVLSTVLLPAGTVLAGELHADKSGGRERVGEVRTALADGGTGLVFSAFDIVQHPDFNWRDRWYPQRLEVLKELLPESGPMRRIPVSELASEAEIGTAFRDITDAGGEGLVIRCSDGRALKLKPEITVDFAVLGFTEREAADGGQELRSMILALAAGDGRFVPLGTVGTFEDGVDRRGLLEILQPLVIDSEYRQAASSGQLYRMVRPEVLVECRLLDLQAEDARGRPIRQPELHVVDGQWQVAGQVIAVTGINPVMTRIRTDKADVQDGARWSQIAEVVAAPAALGEAAASEVVRRQVWTKESKGKTDVRKLVVWRTNKDALDPSFPAYVVHWTDYAAGRKTPLTREVRPAPSLESADALADAMIEENIKKGWSEVT